MSITKEQVKKIIGAKTYSDDKLKLIVDALNDTFNRYEINTTLRMAHFLAQVLHESSAFRYTTEIWGNTPAQLKYDTRIDLGNTPEADGDGYKYRGRGWIQLTGKANYKLASTEFGQDFINKPELLQQYPYAALAAGWFWKRKGLNAYADKDDIMTITKKVNGGYNGLDDRKMWLLKAEEGLK